MRQVLVRATGRRESADDPAFASMIADAARYVSSYTTGRAARRRWCSTPPGSSAPSPPRDGSWQRERPFTLVVLDLLRARAAADARRAELERSRLSAVCRSR